MPVPGASEARTRPVSANESWNLRDRIRVRAEDREDARARLPKLGGGLAWAFKGVESSGGTTWQYFQVVRSDEVRRADVGNVIDAIEHNARMRDRSLSTRVVYNSRELPPPPAGYEWQLLGMFNMTPRKYEYGLVEK